MGNPNLLSDFKQSDSFTPIFGVFQIFKSTHMNEDEKLFSGVKKYAESESELRFYKIRIPKNRIRGFGNIIVIFHKNITSGLKNYEDSESELRISKIRIPKTEFGVLGLLS